MNDDVICLGASGANHRLVLLHGWGADAEDLLPLGRELSECNGKPLLEVVALRAPQLHPEGFGRQWYGLYPANWPEVPGAIRDLQARIQAINNGSSIPLRRTVALGFSQGGAMAIDSCCGLPLAGVIGCSAYPHPGWIPPQKRPPVLLFHGQQDDVVPYAASEQLIRSLRTYEGKEELVNFEGGHEIPQVIIPRIRLALQNWLQF